MSYDYDTIMKQAFSANKAPDEKLTEQIFSKMEERESVQPHSKKGYYVYRPVAAVLAVILLACAGMAGVKGSPLRQWFLSESGEKEKSEVVGKYSAEILSYEVEKTFPHLTIRPEKFITDGMVSYVVLEIKGDDSVKLSKDMYFDNFNLRTEDIDFLGGSTTQGVLEEDKENNIIHFAVRNHTQFFEDKKTTMWSVDLETLMYTAGNQKLVSEGKGFETFENQEKVLEGTYSMMMKVKNPEIPFKLVTDDSFGKGGKMVITSMGIDLELYLPYSQSKMIGDSLFGEDANPAFIELKDGKKVYCDTDDGTGIEEDERTVKENRKVHRILRFSPKEPISINEVEQVYIGALGFIEVE